MKKLLFIIVILVFARIDGFSVEAWEYQESGWKYYNAGKADKALTAFLNSIAVDDENGWGYYGAAIVYHYLYENYGSAEPHYLKAAELLDDPQYAWQNLEWLYYATGDYESMLNASISNLTSSPTNGWGYYGVALALQNLNRKEEAAEFYLTAIELLPDEDFILTLLGWVYIDLGYYQSAADAFLEYSASVPDDGDGYFGAGYAYQLLEDNDSSIKNYLKAVKIEPDYADAWISLGWRYWTVEKYREGLEAFEQVIDLQPINAWAYYGAGLCLQSMEDYSDALEYYLTAEELFDPTNTCLPSIFLCYVNLQDDDKIIDYADQTMAYYRSRGELAEAWVPLSAGNYFVYTAETPQPNTALGYFETVMNEDYDESNKISAYEGAAYAYYLQKDVNHALKYAKLVGEENWIYKLYAPRIITLDYDIQLERTLTYLGYAYSAGTYYFSLPTDNDYQELVSVESTPAYKRLITEDGMNLAEIEFSDGIPEDFKIKIVVKVIVTNLAPDQLKVQKKDGSELANYIDTSAGDREIISAVNNLTKGIKAPLAQINAVHGWIDSNFTHIYYLDEYDNDDPTTWPTYDKISEMIETKVGHCFQFSQLFSAMGRQLGIPIRMIGGAYVDGYGGLAGDMEAHYTVEIWDAENERWFYVEPQNVNLFGINNPNHIVFWNETPDGDSSHLLRIFNIQQNAVKYFDDPGGSYSIEYLD